MNYYNKYHTNAINTGSKEQKIIMMFDEMIKFLFKALKSIENQDFEAKNKNLRVVTNVLYSLRDDIALNINNELTQIFSKFCSASANKLELINIGTLPSSEISIMIKDIAQVRDLFK